MTIPANWRIPKSGKYRKAMKASEKLIEWLSRQLRKENCDLVEDWKPSFSSPRVRRISATSTLASWESRPDRQRLLCRWTWEAGYTNLSALRPAATGGFHPPRCTCRCREQMTFASDLFYSFMKSVAFQLSNCLLWWKIPGSAQFYGKWFPRLL